MRSTRGVFAASLAAFVGRSPGMEPAGWVPPSTLAFSHSGAITGTFSVSGEPSVVPATGYAVGGRDPDYAGTMVVAVLPRTATTNDVVSMMIPRLTSGSSMVDVACVTPGCAGLAPTLCLASAGGPGFSQVCSITTGTGACLSSTFTSTGAFTVTGGTFDVAVDPTDFD